MSKINIHEIGKEMTWKEFKECLKIGINDCLVFEYEGNEFLCPPNIGLRGFSGTERCKCEKENCRECWMKAVENIEFKEEENMKRDLDKEYSVKEMVNFEEGTVFKDVSNTIFTKMRIINGELEEKRGNSDWKKCDWGIKKILTLRLKLVEKQKEVSIKQAMEAYCIGKKIACRYKTINTNENLYREYKGEILGESGRYLWDVNKYTILPQMILTGKWYVVEE